MGFEPTVRHPPHTRFPSVLLKPLGHLSASLTHQSKGMSKLTENNPKVNLTPIHVYDVLEECGSSSCGIRFSPCHSYGIHGICEKSNPLLRSIHSVKGMERADERHFYLQVRFSIVMMSIFAAVSKPSTSNDGSGSAKPSLCAFSRAV